MASTRALRLRIEALERKIVELESSLEFLKGRAVAEDIAKAGTVKEDPDDGSESGSE